ncbi:carbohydrate ABC transporter permease [Taklimakanibacter lacteus]|uniref:carbohydrate ABC transporter permease n=1 Tax=Taklimakanibacter lacteus TaxID=2268456 RepID=UPI000E6610C2
MSPLILLRRIGFYGLLAAILFYTVFPFYWAVVSSLKSGSAIFRVEFLPSAPTLENYRALFAEQSFARNIANSLIVASLATAISLALAVTAAYALGRIRFRGRSAVLFAILSISMFPQIAVLSGLFELIRYFGLYNSLTGLVFSNLILTLPFTVWVLTAFVRELPRELEDSALMDGASSFKILIEIFLPLMAPALAATGLLAFILAWNEFLFALTFTLSNEQRTVPVAIALITGASAYELPWGRVMAASVIVTVPLIALVLILQRHIVSGLVAGAVKG